VAYAHRSREKTLFLESFHTGGQLSDLIFETFMVAEEINKHLPFSPHLMGAIFKDLQNAFINMSCRGESQNTTPSDH
jgi:hypothetical protein